MTQESITGKDRPSDSELLRRAIKNAKPVLKAGETVPRWAVITELLLVGSTTAKALCKRFGIDPDEYLTGTHCDGCPFVEEDEEE